MTVTKHGTERHIRRIENEKGRKSHVKKIHRVGKDHDDDFDPHDLINAFNSGDRYAPFEWYHEQ